MEKQAGRISVHATVKDVTGEKEVVNEEKMIEITPFATEPSKVSVFLGMSVSMGSGKDWKNVKADVGISRPCYQEEENACFDSVQKSVMAKLESLMIDVIGKSKAK